MRIQDNFKNSYLFKNDEKKSFMYLDNYKHLLQQATKKKKNPKLIHMKKKICKKRHTILFL
jgi:hypothetical protein